MHGSVEPFTNRDSASQSPGTSPDRDPQGPPSKSKDPSRPKRKKARRACAACQRAHLTCDDDRPCERCVKRGLQDDCHDGARKKAKYLQDAPDEALKPGAGAYYKHQSSNGNGQSPTKPLASAVPIDTSHAMHVSDNGFVNNPAPSMHGFAALSNNPQEIPPVQTFTSYTPAGPSTDFQPQYSPHEVSAMQNLSTDFSPMLVNSPFDGPFNTPVDPTMFNFDPSSLNFGNQYGALEFGMLGHMASGANTAMAQRTPTFDGSSMGPSAYINTTSEMNPFPFDSRHESLSEWQHNDPRMNSWSSQPAKPYAEGRNEQNAYTIGNPSTSLTGLSPASSNADFMGQRDPTSPNGTNIASRRRESGRQDAGQISEQDSLAKAEREHRPSKAVSKKLEKLPASAATQQRRRNASKIYSSVIKPYPYTARFHALIAVIQRRFRSHKRLRIAKALASIRPSFISCTRTLIEEDLILMEKNFQRSLLEYRDHVSACGTPTIICRRTGEVAYSGESFILLSGWPLGVLQGKEPNLNVNRAGHTSEDDIPSGTMTSSSRGGFTTPKVPSAVPIPASAYPQPVFLMDLLDDDSVIQFYEDFAKIAFADSKGSACRPCKLVKYRTKGDPLSERLRFNNSPSKGKETENGGGGRKNAGEQQDVSRLGADDGTVDCMFCWTVKRDVFEFPMMVVVNFLPILQT